MEITYDEFLKFANKEIIDLRDSSEYLKRHIKGSVNVLFDALIVYPEKYLVKGKNYLLICQSGIKSLKTAAILRNMGYSVYSLEGGIKSLL